MMRAYCFLLFLSAASAVAADTHPVPPHLWKAQWIDVAGATPQSYGVYHFRRSFELPSKPEHFIVYVSGDNRYQLYANGQAVSWGPARGDLSHWRYESVDLAPNLRAGKNVLAAVVWNEGPGKGIAQISNQTGFMLEGERDEDGSVDTNRAWRARQDEAYAAQSLPPDQTTGYYALGVNEHVEGSRYLERTLYNGALSGVSLQGDTYFYMNPLEADKDRKRWEWHECPCCPPMFLKLMGALPGYIYSIDADSLYINLFVSSEATATVLQKRLSIKQKSRYPWDGNVRITIDPADPVQFNLMVRIPEWCRDGKVKVNGKTLSNTELVRGYQQIRRTWERGDVVEVTLPMPVEPVKAHPLVEADAGKVALVRGPLVYCLESVDNGDDTRRLALTHQTAFESHHDPNLLKGVTVITGSATCADATLWKDSLYSPAREIQNGKAIKLTAIPYYANANRGPVEMAVWLPENSATSA